MAGITFGRGWQPTPTIPDATPLPAPTLTPELDPANPYSYANPFGQKPGVPAPMVNPAPLPYDPNNTASFWAQTGMGSRGANVSAPQVPLDPLTGAPSAPAAPPPADTSIPPFSMEAFLNIINQIDPNNWENDYARFQQYWDAWGVKPQRGSSGTGAFRGRFMLPGQAGYDWDPWQNGFNWGKASYDTGVSGAPSGTTTGGGGYANSASTELYVQEILRRLKELHNPIEDPLTPLLYQEALKRIQRLGVAPFTAGEDAALVSRYRDPLTQARDAELQYNRERAAAQQGAEGGLLDLLNRETSKRYTTGLAQGTNDLAVRAVEEKQKREREAIEMLAGLVTADRARRTEVTGQANELLGTAALLPGLDEKRLQTLIAAGQGSAAAGSSSINDLIAKLSQQIAAGNVDAGNSSIWGEILAGAMG